MNYQEGDYIFEHIFKAARKAGESDVCIDVLNQIIEDLADLPIDAIETVGKANFKVAAAIGAQGGQDGPLLETVAGAGPILLVLAVLLAAALWGGLRGGRCGASGHH